MIGLLQQTRIGFWQTQEGADRGQTVESGG